MDKCPDTWRKDVYGIQLFFGIKFVYLIGEVSALDTILEHIGKLLPSEMNRSINNDRYIGICKMKALWESFNKAARQIGKKPEDLLEMVPLVLDFLEKYKGEFNDVRVSPIDQAFNDKCFKMLLAGEKISPIFMH